MTLDTAAATGLADRLDRIFCENACPALIANLTTRLFVHRQGAVALPVTLNDGTAAPTCYICCPTTAYIAYARDELRMLAAHPLAHAAMDLLLRLATPLMRATGFDHQVQPNNWLLATNIWPRLPQQDIEAVTAALLERFPDRAIVWRSLNEISDRPALTAFGACGYTLFPARQIYLFDCRAAPMARHRDEKRDMALLARPDYTVASPADIGAADFDRIATLYGLLYLDKYTWLNPQYSALLLAELHAAGILRFHGLRNRDGVLDGIAGFFDRDDVMTAPVVGYDTGLPLETGLYRRLMAIGLRRAREERLLFNMSAGAASFKRNRGAVPAIEYTAIYNRHLSRRSRLAAGVVRTVLTRIGIPVMRTFKL